MTKAENVETRKSEIRYRTVDTARMRNKYIARNVTRTWKENFLDKDTGKTVEIDHHQVLFEKGTLITDDVLTSIKFWQEEGSLAGKEIEVSNQRRLSFAQRNGFLYPYKASAKINDKKSTFILYATSVANAVVILTDYIELNFQGGLHNLGCQGAWLLRHPDRQPKNTPQEPAGGRCGLPQRRNRS